MTSIELQRRAALKDPIGRFERLVEIRAAEDTIRDLFAQGLVAGSTHTCQGQEAVSVGIATVLRSTDVVTCTYRGHGHALALGMRPERVLAEILGRENGAVGGMGGSMHLSDRRVGLLPTMAIVGAGIPIAAGAALAAQLDGRDDVAVALFGDGTANIGAFHEGLNLAAVWSLPAVFVCENNLYGEYSRIDRTTPVADIAARAEAYGIPGVVVDGQDLEAVIGAMASAVERARAGEGPTLVEMKTYRYAGHSRSDPGTYRPDDEVAAWRERDPIELYARELIAGGTVTAAQVEEMKADLEAQVREAVEVATRGADPELEAMFAHVTAKHRAGVA